MRSLIGGRGRVTYPRKLVGVTVLLWLDSDDEIRTNLSNLLAIEDLMVLGSLNYSLNA